MWQEACRTFSIPYMAKLSREKAFTVLGRKQLAIFTVKICCRIFVDLASYTTDQQGHVSFAGKDSWLSKNYENHKTFPHGSFAIYDILIMFQWVILDYILWYMNITDYFYYKAVAS